MSFSMLSVNKKRFLSIMLVIEEQIKIPKQRKPASVYLKGATGQFLARECLGND